MFLVFDVETNGLPKKWGQPVTDLKNWPRVVQVGYLLVDENGKTIKERKIYVKPQGFVVSEDSTKVNGLTQEFLEKHGEDLTIVLKEVAEALENSEVIVAHNMEFDSNVLGAEFLRNKMPNLLALKNKICTMVTTVEFCALPGKHGYKWPSLQELHTKLFGEGFDGAHDALVDIKITAKCFFKLLKEGLI